VFEHEWLGERMLRMNGEGSSKLLRFSASSVIGSAEKAKPVNLRGLPRYLKRV
jgi:hypothetical protein